MKRTVPIVLLVAAAACTDTPNSPSANLRRPSGMLYLHRSGPVRTATGATSVTTRDDLLIADAESEGVRVRQFVWDKDAKGADTIGDTFIPSDVIFVPLVIAAPGFPEELSASLDASRRRIYTLAPAGVLAEADSTTGAITERVGLLHVLDVPESVYGARASEAGNIPIGVLPLDRIFPDAAIPVDVEVVASDDARDLVLVAFDPIAGGPGRVALLNVTHQGGIALASSVTATIAARPRSLLNAGEGLVLASSAGTSSISELRVDLVAGTFLGTRDLDAGGPTAGLIEVPGYGALALRLDRSAAVVFERSSSGFARSTRVFDSPYTPRAERVQTVAAQRRGEISIGRIDLRPAVVVAGAAGQVQNLSTVAGSRALQPDDRSANDIGEKVAQVILLAHLDGQASFLVGNPPRIATTAASMVQGLVNLGQVVNATAPALEVPECPVNEGSPKCPDSVVAVPQLAETHYWARYQGSLAVGTSGALAVGTGTIAGMVLRDPNVSDFDQRLIQVGDTVDLELAEPMDCLVSTSSTTDRLDQGIVIQVTAEALRLELRGALAGYQACPDPPPVRYEVHPSGEEGVLTEVQGVQVAAVRARVPVTGAGAARSMTFASDVALTVSGPLECTARTNGRLCTADADCGVGRSCTLSSDLGAPGQCQATCAMGSVGCVARPRVRDCSGIELLVSGAGVVVKDTRNTDVNAGQTISRAVVPSAVVFSPLFQQWFISYPGSRTVVGVQPLEGSIATSYVR